MARRLQPTHPAQPRPLCIPPPPRILTFHFLFFAYLSKVTAASGAAMTLAIKKLKQKVIKFSSPGMEGCKQGSKYKPARDLFCFREHFPGELFSTSMKRRSWESDYFCSTAVIPLKESKCVGPPDSIPTSVPLRRGKWRMTNVVF